MGETFESALAGRVAAMADACTRCGKCVEVCPVTGPGGVEAEPRAVIAGIIDILRTGEGPEPSRKWASACVLTGRRRGLHHLHRLPYRSGRRRRQIAGQDFSASAAITVQGFAQPEMMIEVQSIAVTA